MLLKKSRYKNSLPFTPAQNLVGFRGLRARAVTTLDGVVEHTLAESDRLDHLAQHYYGDDRLWWRIVDANPQLLFPDRLHDEAYLGLVILIPQAKV